MIINLDIFNKKAVHINLCNKTVNNIYEIFRKHSIEYNVEYLKLFLELIISMQIEDINFNLDYEMQLELIPSIILEDINSSLLYEIIQEIQMNCFVRDIDISVNLDIEIELSLNCVLDDIKFSCEAILVVVRTYGNIKDLTYADIMNQTLEQLCWTESN